MRRQQQPKRFSVTQQPKRFSVIHLRVDDALHNQLTRAADQHRATVTTEIRHRLLTSFERDTHRALDDIKSDMEICWARWSAHVTRTTLADQIADAIVQGGDPQTIRTLAQLIVRHREEERRAVLGGAL
jgi:hypothetical protein